MKQTNDNVINKNNSVWIIVSAFLIMAIVVGIVFLCIHFSDSFAKKKDDIVTKELVVKEKIDVNVGDGFPNNEDYFDNYNGEKIDSVRFLKDGEEVDSLSLGSYFVEIVVGEKKYNSVLNIIDNSKPVLKLKEVNIKVGEKYSVDSFVDSCTDNSNDKCTISFKKDGMNSYNNPGEYEIVIVAKDSSNNESVQSTKLFIKDFVSSNDVTVRPDTNSLMKAIGEAKKDTNKGNDNNYTSYNDEVKYYKVALLLDEGCYELDLEIKENSILPDDLITTKQGRTFKEWQLNGNTFDPKTKITSDLKLVAVYSDMPVVTYKYGVKVSTVVGITKYDYSTFNGTTEQIKPEAASVATSNLSVYRELLGYVNDLRRNQGKKDLILDSKLSEAATLRAIEMAWSNKVQHTRPNGTECFTVIKEYGISASSIGENIAAGPKTAKDVFKAWDNSNGHHENMVSDFTKIGMGMYTLNGVTYWVQLFMND